jgi:hypothetical protein
VEEIGVFIGLTVDDSVLAIAHPSVPEAVVLYAYVTKKNRITDWIPIRSIQKID